MIWTFEFFLCSINCTDCVNTFTEVKTRGEDARWRREVNTRGENARPKESLTVYRKSIIFCFSDRGSQYAGESLRRVWVFSRMLADIIEANRSLWLVQNSRSRITPNTKTAPTTQFFATIHFVIRHFTSLPRSLCTCPSLRDSCYQDPTENSRARPGFKMAIADKRQYTQSQIPDARRYIFRPPYWLSLIHI